MATMIARTAPPSSHHLNHNTVNAALPMNRIALCYTSHPQCSRHVSAALLDDRPPTEELTVRKDAPVYECNGNPEAFPILQIDPFRKARY
jgi:hypothetical protein